jgi:hypothetical protein
MARRSAGAPIPLVELRRLLDTSTPLVESWLYLCPSVDRGAGEVGRDEAVLVALAVRLQQQRLRVGAVRNVLADLMAVVVDPLVDDWIVVKRPRSKATVHRRDPVDLKALRADASAAVIDATELRQLLSS